MAAITYYHSMLGIMMGVCGRTLDAQGSGSEKRDLLGTGRNQRVKVKGIQGQNQNQKSENKQGLGRGKVTRTRAGA